MAFSRRHYRSVSPREDTAAEIAWRLADNEVRAQLRKEMDEQFTEVCTVEEAKERLRWMDRRYAELKREKGI